MPVDPAGLHATQQTEHYVLFLDILGFADHVRRFPDTNGYYGGLPHLTPIGTTAALVRRVQEVLNRIATHRRIQDHLSHMMVFSDCAFVVCNSALSLAQHAQLLQWDFVSFDMPIRMGMARGTFYPGTFSSTSQPPIINTAVFYGTGIVRAHEAEASGKGCRIFIDASLTAADLADIQKEIRLLKVPSGNPAAPYELNYLFGKPIMPGDTSTGDGYFLASFQQMVKKLPEPVPRKLWIHYSATFDALNRMRRQHGRKPFRWPWPMPQLAIEQAQPI